MVHSATEKPEPKSNYRIHLQRVVRVAVFPRGVPLLRFSPIDCEKIFFASENAGKKINGLTPELWNPKLLSGRSTGKWQQGKYLKKKPRLPQSVPGGSQERKTSAFLKSPPCRIVLSWWARDGWATTTKKSIINAPVACNARAWDQVIFFRALLLLEGLWSTMAWHTDWRHQQ